MHLPTEFYLFTADFAKLGFGAAGDPVEGFFDAVDQYAESRSDGQPTEVIRITREGMKLEAEIVTDLAAKQLKAWMDGRGEYPPEWLCEDLGLEWHEYGDPDEVFEAMQGALADRAYDERVSA